MPLRLAAEQPFGKVVRQVNKAMDPLQKGFFNFCPAETWTPAVNLYESEAAYLLCVDLAGVDKEQIDLTVAGGQLKLRGRRPVPTATAGEEPAGQAPRMRVHLMEIDHGPFCRMVELPNDVDAEKIIATYRNGMLWVELPKR